MESPTYEEMFQNFVKSITKPKTLTSLRYDSFRIIHNNEEIELDDIYTINTVYDLKLAIYEKFGFEDFAAPNNQLILLKEASTSGNEALDFRWDHTLRNPLFVISGKEPLLTEFVTNEGTKRIVDIQIYDNILIEKRLRKSLLHLYFLKDILSYYNGTTPIPEKEYYGRLYPYYPLLKINESYPNEQDKMILQTKFNLFKKKREYIQKIQVLLSDDNPLVPLTFSGFRSLKMSFLNNSFESGIEPLFYEIDVNETLPYLRFIPVGSTPISKIHLSDEAQNIPSVYDPNLIKSWSDEKSPTSDRDFIMGKISLKTTFINLPYIYGTLRFFDDDTFDVTIQPPKDIRKVDPFIDFENFIPSIINGLKRVNKNKEVPTLNSTSLIFGLKMSKEITLSKKQFEKRLSLFKPFFQEIPALPNDQPFAMLRYKIVDNYITEDNISTFLSLLAHKKMLKGEATISEAIQMVSEEFQLDLETSRKKVSNWLSQRDEIQPVVAGESKEYVPYNNSGIDIAIYQKKSIYAIHITNVNSIVNLERIITAFKLIFSLDEQLLSISPKEAIQLQQAEQKVNELQRETLSSVESSDEGDAASVGDYEYDPLMFEGLNSSNSSEEDTRSIKEEIAKDILPADVELRGTEIKTAEIKKPPVLEEEPETAKEKGLANFFLKKLKDVDSALFEYTPKNPSEKQYVQMCAANEMRQPSVLTQEQYQAMIEEYGDDVIFQKYPLEEGEKDIVDVRSDPDKIVTVLEYGSNPRRMNYYVCSEFFCTRDEIVVLKEDFVGTELRRPIKQSDGSMRTTKPRNTCPFCMGKLVVNRKNPSPGETVLQRIPKRSSDKRHVWVDFLKKTTHPDGLKLPCCFVRPSPITFKDTESGFLKKKKKVEKTEEDDDDDEEHLETLESGVPIIDYATTLYRIDKKYIIGLTDKYLPLEIGDRDGPQVGVLPQKLNELFEQDISKIIARVGNPQKVLPNAKGFLRIGVENRGRYKYDSFLAAIAPFYLKNSAFQMKKRLNEVLSSAKLFTNLNYGNMVLEFYDPNYEIKEVFNNRVWADKNLDIDYNENNKEEVDRIIKSYYKFKEFLYSDSTTKEYRQFAHLLAQPGLVQGDNRPGINFIVLDIKEDESIHVRCPPYGYHNRYMQYNDVAFLLHHHTGSWEPIFYLDNAVTGLESRQPYTLTFQYANYASWPNVAKKIYGQYVKACDSSQRIIYTTQSYINANSLIPLTLAENLIYKLKQKSNLFSYNGILRDPYNHISAIVCSENRTDKRINILVPVIDDGLIGSSINKDIYLHPDDIEYESLEETVRIYNQYILPTFSRYTGYAPMNIVVNSDKLIVGLQLKNLLYVPVKKAQTTQVSLPIVEVDEFEWEINKDILFGKDEQFQEIQKKVLEQKEFEEIYQHLRLTFSKWLDSKGSITKRKLEDDIIFNSTISLNDKRRRFITLFGPLIQSWFSTETNETEYTSLLRKDCIQMNSKESCTDRCVFTTEGKCKIHISEQFKEINLGNYLMLKLFDEIIRFAEKRREIFENEISQLVFLDKAIRIGDQFIVPENTAEWSDFLRFSFTETHYEKPKFIEEFSSEADEESEKEDSIELKELPLGIKSILNPDDPKTKLLKYNELTKETSLVPILDELSIDAAGIGYTDSITFNSVMLSKMYRAKKAAFIQINMLTKDFDPNKNITIVGFKNAEIKDIYIIFIGLGSSGLIVKNINLTLKVDDLPQILKQVILPP
jgi:hypothetical protein